MTPLDRHQYIQAVLEQIAAQLEIRRAERALKQAAMGVSKNTAGHLLSGTHDYRLSSLVIAADSAGCDVIVELRPRNPNMLGHK